MLFRLIFMTMDELPTLLLFVGPECSIFINFLSKCSNSNLLSGGFSFCGYQKFSLTLMRTIFTPICTLYESLIAYL